MNNHFWAQAALLSVIAFCLAACDTDTSSMGVFSDTDAVSSSSEQFQFYSRSVTIDSVVANSRQCYLGQIVDPETDAELRAEFVAQFHTFENYSLPKDERLVLNDKGELVADSVEICLYFTDYYGDGDNPMKLSVYELDTANVMREDWTYYTDQDFTTYLPAGAQPLATKVFTPEDYTLPDTERTSLTHNDNVRIILPVSYGTRILRSAKEHPEFFRDSWQFLHHVCPGFYFKLERGEGTMLSVDVSALNIYFRYRNVKADSIYTGIVRFSATPEVIQSTHFDTERQDDLLADNLPYTYLKSPVGIATELCLPVDEIFKGHENDSINRARVVLTRYNSLQGNYTFGTPSHLVMVPSSRAVSFFKNHEIADGETSYITSFDSNYNTYSFTNISRLLSWLYRQKQQGMKKEGLTSDQWNSQHPGWNCVRVIPVKASSATDSSSGATYVTSVTHEFSLSSIRLVGGTQPLTMQVIYSRYQ